MNYVIQSKYVTPIDGRTFDTEEEALEHLKELEFLQWCERNICVGGEWSSSMVARAILENFVVTRRYSKTSP